MNGLSKKGLGGGWSRKINRFDFYSVATMPACIEVNYLPLQKLCKVSVFICINKKTYLEPLNILLTFKQLKL